jgi:hypothetical protein
LNIDDRSLEDHERTKYGTLLNFPMQANGAEMLRLACIYATEAGVQVCAPVHDALLIEGPEEGIMADISRAEQAMALASEAVLGGFRLRVDGVDKENVISHPNRFQAEDKSNLWAEIWRILREIEAEKSPLSQK